MHLQIDICPPVTSPPPRPGKTRTSPKTITTPQVGVTNVQEDGVTVGVSLYLGPCPGEGGFLFTNAALI